MENKPMTVGELIEKLQQFDPKTPIVISSQSSVTEYIPLPIHWVNSAILKPVYKDAYIRDSKDGNYKAICIG